MDRTAIPTPHELPDDEDLAEQALPGHGIPSQDPNPAAQVMLPPDEVRREAKTVWMGGGVALGMVVGAIVGILQSGAAGAVVGATLGAGAGALVARHLALRAG